MNSNKETNPNIYLVFDLREKNGVLYSLLVKRKSILLIGEDWINQFQDDRSGISNWTARNMHSWCNKNFIMWKGQGLKNMKSINPLTSIPTPPTHWSPSNPPTLYSSTLFLCILLSHTCFIPVLLWHLDEENDKKKAAYYAALIIPHLWPSR